MCKRKLAKIGRHTQHHNFSTKKEQASTSTTALPTALPTAFYWNYTTKIPSNDSNGTFVTIKKKLKFWVVWDEVFYPKECRQVEQLYTTPLIEKFKIEFPVTMEMLPSCQVMVYYVREDNEVVADTVELHVEGKLENQVKRVL